MLGCTDGGKRTGPDPKKPLRDHQGLGAARGAIRQAGRRTPIPQPGPRLEMDRAGPTAISAPSGIRRLCPDRQASWCAIVWLKLGRPGGSFRNPPKSAGWGQGRRHTRRSQLKHQELPQGSGSTQIQKRTVWGPSEVCHLSVQWLDRMWQLSSQLDWELCFVSVFLLRKVGDFLIHSLLSELLLCARY